MPNMAKGGRDRICEAAIEVASRDGLLSMTLDNVAKEAGISKGGVMYHFHTKEELVAAMLEYFGAKLEQQFMQRMANDSQPGFRWARSMLSCVFPEQETQSDESSTFPPKLIERFMLSTLAAAVNSPTSFEPLRAIGIRLRDRLLNERDGGMDQLLVWLAVDGLFLWQFIGMISCDEPLYQQIGDALRAKVAPPPRKAKKKVRKSKEKMR